MKTIRKSSVAVAAVLAMATLPALAQTTVVTTPEGSTTQVTTTTPDGGATINVTVNNQPVAFQDASRPRMMQGRVMVPLRGVVERLGGNVLYDPQTQVITGAQPNTEAQFRIRVGSGEALLNGKKMPLDAPPRVIAGVTYVPLRFVSEALGADVRWDNARRTVEIATDGRTATVSTGS